MSYVLKCQFIKIKIKFQGLKKHIDWLKSKYTNVTSKKIELDKTFESFVSSVPNNSSDKHELSLANTRSRLRMVTLYYFSALNDYIVAGTGNRVEDFGIGFIQNMVTGVLILAQLLIY